MERTGRLISFIRVVDWRSNQSDHGFGVIGRVPLFHDRSDELHNVEHVDIPYCALVADQSTADNHTGEFLGSCIEYRAATDSDNLGELGILELCVSLAQRNVARIRTPVEAALTGRRKSS